MDSRARDRFVAMRVNELTLDYGERGREAVQRLLIEDRERGIIPRVVDVEVANSVLKLSLRCGY